MQGKVDTILNSDAGTMAKALAPVSLARAKQFITELANLRDGDTLASERFKSKFAELLPPESEMESLLLEFHRAVTPPSRSGEAVVKVLRQGESPFVNPLAWGVFQELTGKPLGSVEFINPPPDIALNDWWVDWLKWLLRFAWDARDARGREFIVLRLLRMDPASVLWLLRPGSNSLPSPLMQVLRHLFKLADRMRHCGNPDCVAPYFFAARRSQKYCSDACSLPSQREFKRQWWAEHGSQRRKARKHGPTRSQRKRGN
jgi:hypothetical protein